MTVRRTGLGLLGCVMFAWTCVAGAQPPPSRLDTSNRLNNAFRTQFKPLWNISLRDPALLMEVGPVTDAKRVNLVLLLTGLTATDTQRKLRVMHWNGNSFDTDCEVLSQSIGIDTLLLGHFHPGMAAPQSLPSQPTTASAKNHKPRPSAPSHTDQVLTNSGIYTWSSGTLQPVFARQLPDVKQSIVLDHRLDMVVVGAGDGSSAFEFSQTEMRPAAKDRLLGNGYAHFGIGMQAFPGSDTVLLAPGIRYVQSIWTGRMKWLIGLIRGRAAGTVLDPAATTGDRLVVFTPKFQSRDKSFWECKMDDFEQAWQSDPLVGRVLDVRVGDPHNDGKTGILVLTAENEDKDRRISFFVGAAAG